MYISCTTHFYVCMYLNVSIHILITVHVISGIYSAGCNVAHQLIYLCLQCDHKQLYTSASFDIYPHRRRPSISGRLQRLLSGISKHDELNTFHLQQRPVSFKISRHLLFENHPDISYYIHPLYGSTLHYIGILARSQEHTH